MSLLLTANQLAALDVEAARRGLPRATTIKKLIEECAVRNEPIRPKTLSSSRPPPPPLPEVLPAPSDEACPDCGVRLEDAEIAGHFPIETSAGRQPCPGAS